ncbi:MAG TPA: 50S ribosomal protein L15 [Bacillota bacterium]|nr:50S ribosomal protein L15 [Bacillota bacterium]HOA16095.1 50S ribosomal protein L15 [Bacillota bacterium]HOG52971.1 50S ribosomal protein L15 [Bacillota bacterium]
MKLHELRPPEGSKKERHRVGRGHGSGWERTAGKGQKGQKSRSGGVKGPAFEGGQTPLSRRIPKRGFNNKFRIEYAVVNISQLDEKFESGAQVKLEDFYTSGLVKGRYNMVKVLGDGEITKPLTVSAHKFSESAAEKIKAAGGSVEVV